jgi:hypothetical protein
MMCFRDTTFCASKNCVNKCGRKLTQEVKDAAERWWGKENGEPPIGLSYFCDE